MDLATTEDLERGTRWFVPLLLPTSWMRIAQLSRFAMCSISGVDVCAARLAKKPAEILRDADDKLGFQIRPLAFVSLGYHFIPYIK